MAIWRLNCFYEIFVEGSTVQHNELGSIFYCSRSNCNGFINWVTNGKLQLLWLDRENIYSTSTDTEQYFSDFSKFIEIVLHKNIGVFSGTNINESMLKLIESPLPLKIDIKKLGLENVIKYELKSLSTICVFAKGGLKC